MATVASARFSSVPRTSIHLTAVPLTQNQHQLYVTPFPAGDLVRMTRVDPYRSELPPDHAQQGYQRPPERSRITRIGSYLIKELGDGLFPTAVVLAARAPLTFDPAASQLTLSLDAPLQVIDGQHRIAGLRYAIEEKGLTQFGDFAIPAVIVEVTDRITEMSQFRIINGTAKSVRTDLVNAILTATVSSRDESAIKESDRWKVVVTKVVDRLNREEASPWFEMIAMPDEVSRPRAESGAVVRATSFMTSLRPVYVWLKELGFFHGQSTTDEAEKMFDILAAYWHALRDVVPDAFGSPQDFVLQKTPGLFSLHLLLQEELLPATYHGRRPWTRETFASFLTESPEICDPRFWHVAEGRAAAYGSMKGFRELADLLIQSVTPVP